MCTVGPTRYLIRSPVILPRIAGKSTAANSYSPTLSVFRRGTKKNAQNEATITAASVTWRKTPAARLQYLIETMTHLLLVPELGYLLDGTSGRMLTISCRQGLFGHLDPTPSTTIVYITEQLLVAYS